MDFIIKRRIRQFDLGKRREPLIASIREKILYADDAIKVLERFVPDVKMKEHPLRMARKKGSQEFYWVYELKNLQYGVKIGIDSELFVAPCGILSVWLEELPTVTTLEIPLKDCRKQTKENTLLYLSVIYDPNIRDISLHTLNLRGIRIGDFPHGFWSVKHLIKDGVLQDGCCGSVIYDKVTDKRENRYVPFWTGTKVLKIFKKEEYGCTIDFMLLIWKKFWTQHGR